MVTWTPNYWHEEINKNDQSTSFKEVHRMCSQSVAADCLQTPLCLP